MEFVIVMLCFLIVFTSVSFTYMWYQVRLAQQEVDKAIQVCRAVVTSANAGRWM